MKLEGPDGRKDSKLKRLTSLFGGIIPFLVFVVGIVLAVRHCSALWSGNPECDKRCRGVGYPAGEVLPPSTWKHRVCVCWPKDPQPPRYFLLERDD